MRRAAAVAGIVLTWQTILGAVDRTPGPLLRNFTSPAIRFWVEQAIEGAARRLDSPECRRVLSDFRDGSGVVLEARLKMVGVTPANYLTRWVWFIDGSDQPQCDAKYRRNAFTQPGSRVVFICGQRIVSAVSSVAASERDIVIIHEMLHTLRLGEDPPSSVEITTRVTARCGR